MITQLGNFTKEKTWDRLDSANTRGLLVRKQQLRDSWVFWDMKQGCPPFKLVTCVRGTSSQLEHIPLLDAVVMAGAAEEKGNRALLSRRNQNS